jgi:hypothetical protein
MYEAVHTGMTVVVTCSVVTYSVTTLHVTAGAKMNHGQTTTHKTHKTHHGPDLGEATTFPLMIYYVPLHEAHIPNGNPEIPEVRTPATLGPHNFVYRLSIKMRSKAKL